MKFIKKIYLPIFILLMLLFFVFLPQAQAAGGLIPCGPGKAPCTICHVFELIKNIINFLVIYVTAPLAGLLFLWGGIMMITSGGSEDKFKKGKTMFVNTVIGAVIVLASWAIVNTLITTLASNTSGVNVVNWWVVNCQ
jgi:hypothetical protein